MVAFRKELFLGLAELQQGPERLAGPKVLAVGPGGMACSDREEHGVQRVCHGVRSESGGLQGFQVDSDLNGRVGRVICHRRR